MQSEKKDKDKCFFYKIGIGILFPIAFGIGMLYLYFSGSPFRCWFYQLTGLYCTGCGSGRAAYQIIHGHFIKAADYNLFFVLFLPVLSVYCLKFYIEVIFDKKILKKFVIKRNHIMIILLFILLFTLFRNIKLFPFTYLAP